MDSSSHSCRKLSLAHKSIRRDKHGDKTLQYDIDKRDISNVYVSIRADNHDHRPVPQKEWRSQHIFLFKCVPCSQDRAFMTASISRKPWILWILLLIITKLLRGGAFGSMFGTRQSHAALRKRTLCCAEMTEWDLDLMELESVLQAAHTAWGRLFEAHATQKLGTKYSPVLEAFSVDMGKKGQIDFLGVADGYEAWEDFAKDHMTHMHNSTCATLHAPHFLIAEIGLTTQTLVNKFKDNATSLRLMETFVSTMRSKSFSAAKCLVYDGADAEDFTKTNLARQFLDEGGILIDIPYLSAETVLAKLNETTKLREELQALRADLKLSGLTLCHASCWKTTHSALAFAHHDTEPWTSDQRGKCCSVVLLLCNAKCTSFPIV